MTVDPALLRELRLIRLALERLAPPSEGPYAEPDPQFKPIR